MNRTGIINSIKEGRCRRSFADHGFSEYDDERLSTVAQVWKGYRGYLIVYRLRTFQPCVQPEEEEKLKVKEGIQIIKENTSEYERKTWAPLGGSALVKVRIFFDDRKNIGGNR